MKNANVETLKIKAAYNKIENHLIFFFFFFVIWPSFICRKLSYFRHFCIEKYVNMVNSWLADQQNVAMTSQQEGAERGTIKSLKLRVGTIYFV